MGNPELRDREIIEFLEGVKGTLIKRKRVLEINRGWWNHERQVMLLKTIRIMHESLKRMEWFADKYLSKAETERIKVLDVGSYNVNGCYRNIFTDKGYEYKGLDMEDGSNVDVVPRNTYKWDEIETNSFDAVISGQALEHIEFFLATVAEMVKTKDGGLICIIAPKGFEEHRYPVDCWRFSLMG